MYKIIQVLSHYPKYAKYILGRTVVTIISPKDYNQNSIDNPYFEGNRITAGSGSIHPATNDESSVFMLPDAQIHAGAPCL